MGLLQHAGAEAPAARGWSCPRAEKRTSTSDRLVWSEARIFGIRSSIGNEIMRGHFIRRAQSAGTRRLKEKDCSDKGSRSRITAGPPVKPRQNLESILLWETLWGMTSHHVH